MMKLEKHEKNGTVVVKISTDQLLITDAQSALDLIASVIYENDNECSGIILDQSAICENFFKLSSGLAGDILQKFINYHIKFSIIGNFSIYHSKPLYDFIYECNQGNVVFFAATLEEAVNYMTSS